VLELAVRRSLRALAVEERLTESDAARTALALSLAQVIETKQRTGRLSTVSNDARVLMELLESLKPSQLEDDDEELKRALREWGEDHDDDQAKAT
jgi:hypothetical protein